MFASKRCASDELEPVPSHGLRFAVEEAAGIMNYEFKRLTAVVHNPPRDFASDTEAPVGLIENAGMTA